MNRRDALCLVGTSIAGLSVPRMVASSAAGTVGPFETVLNGFHVHKKRPHLQLETNQHWARLSADVWQCVIFHGLTGKLLGFEYVVSDRLYRKLTLEEKVYWHPHAYEVLSGQLIAPHLAPDQEEALMRDLVTTWGKAWQAWPDLAADLPEGEPQLLWSVTGDGQMEAELLHDRDRRFHVSTRANRARRRTFGFCVPQVEAPESVQEIGRQWSGLESRRPGEPITSGS